MKKKPLGPWVNQEQLEAMRQHVLTLYRRRFLPSLIVLILSFSLILFFNRKSLFYLMKGSFSRDAALGLLLFLLGQLMLTLMVSAIAFLIYLFLVWKPQYDQFNSYLKRQYLVQELSQLPGFSQLQFDSRQAQYSYQDLAALHLFPMGSPRLFQSTDRLDGIFDRVPFHSGMVVTADPPPAASRRSLPDELFSGQVLAFSATDYQTISPSRVQVLSRDLFRSGTLTTLPCPIPMEWVEFDEVFLVFGENEYTARSVLTREVQGKILSLSRLAGNAVSLLFDQSTLFVAIRQNHNPFDASIHLPLPAQRKQLVSDSQLLQRAREILVSSESDLH